MDNIHKKTLVGLQVEKAKRFLAQADEMVELKHWDLAANRYYYASFHAVQALFIAKGINAHTHAGINAQFSLHFVRTKIVDISYGSFSCPYVSITTESGLQLRLRYFRG